MRYLKAFALLFAFLAPLDALAQAIGGNVTLAVSSTSANVQIPASNAFPALMIIPAPGTSTEIFYNFGTTSAVTATNTSPSLPFGGVCFDTQGPNTYIAAIDPSGTANVRITQLSRCPPVVNNNLAIPNPLPVSGTLTATVGGYAPTPSYASPLSVSTTSARTALPTGTTVIVYNTGTNNAYVILGNASVTATLSDDVITPGSWLALTVGSNVDLAAITSVGTTTLNISGGSGLPTGSGGNSTVAATQSGTWTIGVSQWAGSTLGAISTYGTSPGAILVPAVDAFVTNSNANGAALPANSSPVVISLPLSPATTTSLGTSLVVKASAGNLYGFYCNAIAGGSPGYCIAYNGTAAPSTGALTGANVLDVCYFSGIAGCSLNRTPIPRAYSTGIVVIVSSASTPFTYTTGVDTAYISADYQ